MDIGCGDGSLTLDYLKENKITFLDITPEMLDIVKTKISDEYFGNDILIYDINIFEFNTENKYDIIICVGVYAHVT